MPVRHHEEIIQLWCDVNINNPDIHTCLTTSQASYTQRNILPRVTSSDEIKEKVVKEVNICFCSSGIRVREKVCYHLDNICLRRGIQIKSLSSLADPGERPLPAALPTHRPKFV